MYVEPADKDAVTWKKHILVVANITATSDELRTALLHRAASEPVAFTLFVPATALEGGRAAASERLRVAIEDLRAAGLELDGEVADGDPFVVVAEAWDPMRYDEIIVSTLPMRVSKWLHAGLPERIGAFTGALVTHVVATPRRHIETRPAPHREKSAMGPLSVLTWGAPHRATERARGPARARPTTQRGPLRAKRG